MRLPREITDEECNARTEELGNFIVVRRDPIEAESLGTILLIPFRVVGFDPDCDGSLMARLEYVGLDNLELRGAGEDIDKQHYDLRDYTLYPETGFVVTADELREMRDQCREEKDGPAADQPD